LKLFVTVNRWSPTVSSALMVEATSCEALLRSLTRFAFEGHRHLRQQEPEGGEQGGLAHLVGAVDDDHPGRREVEVGVVHPGDVVEGE
jgi:hypothetical protein